jgi:hypothetical protein
MAQPGDIINYVGDGNNGTTTGTAYSGILVRVNAPSGWGPTDISIVVGGTPTVIINVLRDNLFATIYQDSGTQPNGTWRPVP